MPSQPSVPLRVAIDLETTGLNAESDAIIEVGAVRFAGDEVLDTFETLVAPSAALPYRIQRLTGIRPGEVRRAPTLSQVLGRLRIFVGDAPLVGHNVAFDAGFLRRAGIVARNPLIDTYELASMLLPNLASYSLASVGAAMGLSSPERHRALADADLARRIFLALLARLSELDTGVLEALQELPVAHEWTLGYLVRSQLRARRESRSGGSGGGFGGALTTSLGDQLARQLGVDPAVLSLAGATARRPVIAATLDSPDGCALPADRLAAAASHVAPALEAGGALLLEVEHDRLGLVACVTPALRWAAQTGNRLVIATADGDALRRIAREVIPDAVARLGGEADTLTVAEVAKREAYLCLWRWFGMARAATGIPLSRDVTRGLTKLLLWTRETPSGMRADVAISGQEQLAWERVRAGRELIDSAPSCPYDKGGHCFLSHAQRDGGEARVVVTTHAALAARLAGTDDLLGEAARVLVLDAHLLEEELRSARTILLDRTGLLELLGRLAEVGPEGRAGLLHATAWHIEPNGKASSERAWFEQIAGARRCVEAFFGALRSVMLQADSARSDANGAPLESPDQRALRIDDELRRSHAWQRAARDWEALARELTSVVRLLRDLAAKARSADRRLSGSGSGLPIELLGVARQLEALVAGGTAIFAEDDVANTVHWLRVPYPQGVDRAGRQADVRHMRQRGRGGAKGTQAKQAGKPERPQVPTQATIQAQPDAESPPTADVAEATEATEAAAHESASDAQITQIDAQRAEGQSQAGASPATAPSAANGEEMPGLHAAPIHVGSMLEALTAAGRGVILASPALAVAGDFEHLRGSLGLPETTRGVSLAADRVEQTLLGLPSDVPEPNAPHFQRSLEETLIALGTALQGRLVAIFPSHAALRSSYNGIRRALEAKDILVLAQGQDGSARQLWQHFATQKRIVLLGAGVFWDGSLQQYPPACVVVTRLPFPALSDPLLAARADGWDDPQSQFVVPQAALKLRQALSGLAWSHSARNAVVLFDRRAQTRGYGPTVLGTLPRCSQHQEPAAALAERIAEWVGPA